MVTKTQHIIKNTLNGYKDIIKRGINNNCDQSVLVLCDSVVAFIQNHPKVTQNGCSLQHKVVWDANRLRVKSITN